MLMLFTYADINAVHPDALTPWKAENLWQLYIATANYLERSVDDERLGEGQGPACAAYRLTWHLTANDFSPGRSCMLFLICGASASHSARLLKAGA